MNKRILVTYASRSGSTAEIAEAIGKTLNQHGIQADVLPMRDVKDLSRYDAVVAGSAIRGSKWLPEAMDFIRSHRAELLKKPVSTFTVCITLAMSNSDQYRQAVRGWIEPIRAQLKPVSDGLFAGRLDFTKLPLNFDTLKLRLVVAIGIFPKDDRRDWNAIHAYAEGTPLIAIHLNFADMDTPHIYEIRVEGQLADSWSAWFEGLAIRNETNGDTTLTGVLTDQAALYGVLTKIHNLNLILVTVQRSSPKNEM